MNRRHFLKTASMGALAVTGGAVPAMATAPGDKPPVTKTPGALRGYPVLMNPAGDSLSVIWLSEGECAGVVEYGDAPDKLTKVAEAAPFGIAAHKPIHQVRLENLPLGKPVYYRVVTRKTPRAKENLTASATYAFTLPRPDEKDIFFAAINDTHENFPVIDKLLARIAEHKPAFFIWNGDIFNSVGNTEHIVKNVLLPVDRPFAASIPMLYARGNHDARGNAAGLPEFIGMPAERLYYTFRQGPVAFIVLDTCEDKVDEKLGATACFEQYLRKQTDWLAAELERPEIKSAPMRIAVLHIPLWSTNYWPGMMVRGLWLPLLEKAGVNLLLSGHIHTYEFLAAGDNARSKKYDPAAPVVSIPQLIGGGPSAPKARLMLLRAGSGKIAIETENIDGKVVANHTIKV